MAPGPHDRRAGYFWATLSALAAGAVLVLGKLGLESLAPVTFSFFVFLFSTPFSAVTMRLGAGWRRYPATRIAIGLLLAHVGLSCAAIWCFWAGLTHLDPTVAGFLNRTETILIVPFGIVFFRERFRVMEGVAAGVAVVGIAVMKLPAEGVDAASVGFWLVLLSSLLFALTECVSKLVVRHVAITVLAFYRNLLLTLVFAMFAFLTGRLTLPTLAQTVPILGVALLGPIAARILFFKALRTLELGKASIVTQSQPLFAAALALVLIGDVPRPVEWLGGALVLGGCVGLILARPAPKALAAGAVALLLLAGCAAGPSDLRPPGPERRVPSAPPIERRELDIGRSVEGRPITCISLGTGRETVLFLASIHGSEPAGTPLLRRLARQLEASPALLAGRRVLIVPAANPDGMALGRRGNARGVDLNRNFPAENFRASRGRGASPLSEPESRALFDLVVRHAPRRVVSIHQPLACLDHDGPAEALARAMASECDLPVKKLGSRPGSFGSWVGLEFGRPIVTVELPRVAHRLPVDELWSRYGRMLLAAILFPDSRQFGSDPK